MIKPLLKVTSFGTLKVLVDVVWYSSSGDLVWYSCYIELCT